MVHLDIWNPQGKTLVMEVIMLPKVTTDLPSHPVPLNCKRKHLSNIHLADPDFGTSGSVHLLLGANVLNCTMHNGWQFGPSGSPFALKTCFGWVLAGVTHNGSYNNWLNWLTLILFVLSLLLWKRFNFGWRYVWATFEFRNVFTRWCLVMEQSRPICPHTRRASPTKARAC